MKEDKERSGMNFVEYLQLLLVVLKGFGFINWSWFWVFTPIWINVVLFIVLLGIAGICWLVDKYKNRIKPR